MHPFLEKLGFSAPGKEHIDFAILKNAHTKWQEKIRTSLTPEVQTKLFFISATIIFLSTLAFLIIPESLEIVQVKQQTTALQNEISGSFETGPGLKTKLTNLKKEIAFQKELIDEKNREMKNALERIIPETSEEHVIVKLLEDFSIRYHSPSSPITLENLSFPATGNGKEQKKMEGFFILPFQMTVKASDDAFKTLLAFLEHSGSLDPNDFFQKQPIRLMTITSLQVPLAESTKTGETKSYQIGLQAYYRSNITTSPERGGNTQ